MLRLTMIQQQAQQYADLFDAWRGPVEIHTAHQHNGTSSIKVSPEDTVDITEVGVMISWRGDNPSGRFLPWGEVISIDQVEA